VTQEIEARGVGVLDAECVFPENKFNLLRAKATARDRLGFGLAPNGTVLNLPPQCTRNCSNLSRTRRAQIDRPSHGRQQLSAVADPVLPNASHCAAQLAPWASEGSEINLCAGNNNQAGKSSVMSYETQADRALEVSTF